MEYVHGGDVYTHKDMVDFSANINPLGPSEVVVAAAQKAVMKMSQYPDAKCRELRSALADKMNINPGYLVFGNGAAELIFMLTMAVQPKRALLLAPSFAEYKQALAASGCSVSYFTLQENKGFQLDEEYLEYLNPDIDMVFLCSPNNPVGNVIEHGLLLKILEKCQENRIRMVVDECFYEFLETWQEDTLERQIENYSMLFILRAFTKMHAMAGLRLGYGICQDLDLLEQMERIRQPWSVSVVAQDAGLAAVGDPAWPIQTRAFLKTEREWVTMQLACIGVTYYPPAANYILIKSDYDLYEILKLHNILIRDCSNYDGLAKGYYRIAIRSRAENQKLLTELAVVYDWHNKVRKEG